MLLAVDIALSPDNSRFCANSQPFCMEHHVVGRNLSACGKFACGFLPNTRISAHWANYSASNRDLSGENVSLEFILHAFFSRQLGFWHAWLTLTHQILTYREKEPDCISGYKTLVSVNVNLTGFRILRAY